MRNELHIYNRLLFPQTAFTIFIFWSNYIYDLVWSLVGRIRKCPRFGQSFYPLRFQWISAFFSLDGSSQTGVAWLYLLRTVIRWSMLVFTASSFFLTLFCVFLWYYEHHNIISCPWVNDGGPSLLSRSLIVNRNLSYNFPIMVNFASGYYRYLAVCEVGLIDTAVINVSSGL